MKSGQLRALAHTGHGRLAAFPDLPPVSDTLPGFEAFEWNGVFVPAGTPAQVVSRLTRRQQLPARAEDRERLARSAWSEAEFPAEFAAFFKSEVEKWAS